MSALSRHGKEPPRPGGPVDCSLAGNICAAAVAGDHDARRVDGGEGGEEGEEGGDVGEDVEARGGEEEAVVGGYEGPVFK